MQSEHQGFNHEPHEQYELHGHFLTNVSDVKSLQMKAEGLLQKLGQHIRELPCMKLVLFVWFVVKIQNVIQGAAICGVSALRWKAQAGNTRRVLKRLKDSSQNHSSALTRSGRPCFLGSEALAALGAAARNDLLAILGGHTGAVAVAALAHKAARLIGTFRSHGGLRLVQAGPQKEPELRKEARG